MGLNKKFFIRTLFLGLLFSAAAFAASPSGEFEHPIEKAFLPMGFDNNDSIQIVLTGSFQKGCLQLGRVNSIVDHNRKEILLSLVTYEQQGTCVDAGAPFHQVVYLGLIDIAGKYSVIDYSTKRKLGILVIDEASDSGIGTDNGLYANLSDAFLTKENNSDVLVLRGMQIAKCAPLGKVEFRVQDDVLIVLPTQPKANRANCLGTPKGFERRVVVDKALPGAPFLLHVRSMGGQAINKLMY